MKLKIEQLEPVEYLAKLQGVSVAKLVHKILDTWLTENFYEASMMGEIKHGLLHVAECRDSRGRLNQRQSLRVMRQNMRVLKTGSPIPRRAMAKGAAA